MGILYIPGSRSSPNGSEQRPHMTSLLICSCRKAAYSGVLGVCWELSHVRAIPHNGYWQRARTPGMVLDKHSTKSWLGWEWSKSSWLRLRLWTLGPSVSSSAPRAIADMSVLAFRCLLVTGASIPVVAGLSPSWSGRLACSPWALSSISGTRTHTK